MTAAIVPFPRERARASGALQPEHRAYYLVKITEVFSELRDSATGELVPASEGEKLAHDLLARIDRARAELYGNKQ